MGWIIFNDNPTGRHVGDCAVRAVSNALNMDWESAYALLCMNGYAMGDMPNSNEVITATLRQKGFYKTFITDTCPDCYTIHDFCEDFPKGTYVVFSDNHVVCIKDGDYYDAWDSGDKPAYFYCYRKE